MYITACRPGGILQGCAGVLPTSVSRRWHKGQFLPPLPSTRSTAPILPICLYMLHPFCLSRKQSSFSFAVSPPVRRVPTQSMREGSINPFDDFYLNTARTRSINDVLRHYINDVTLRSSRHCWLLLDSSFPCCVPTRGMCWLRWRYDGGRDGCHVKL